MKKLMVSVLAAFMVFAIAGAASAAAVGDLVAIIYNDTDNEVGLNLGAISGGNFQDHQVGRRAGAHCQAHLNPPGSQAVEILRPDFLGLAEIHGYFRGLLSVYGEKIPA